MGEGLSNSEAVSVCMLHDFNKHFNCFIMITCRPAKEAERESIQWLNSEPVE